MDYKDAGEVSDAEMQALGALALVEQASMANENRARAHYGQAPAYGDDEGPTALRLREVLIARGVLK